MQPKNTSRLTAAGYPSPRINAGASRPFQVTGPFRTPMTNTYDNEVFFGSGFSNDQVYPRAAIGSTKNGVRASH